MTRIDAILGAMIFFSLLSFFFTVLNIRVLLQRRRKRRTVR